MTPYSFWCSRCKKDHAGECTSSDVYLEKPRQEHGGRVYNPVVGSLWRAQIQDALTGNWHDSNPWNYKVEHVGSGSVQISCQTSRYTYGRTHWRDEGDFAPTGGNKLRFLPAP